MPFLPVSCDFMIFTTPYESKTMRYFFVAGAAGSAAGAAAAPLTAAARCTIAMPSYSAGTFGTNVRVASGISARRDPTT